MSAFATVSESLARWPAQPASQAEGTARRLLSAMEQARSQPGSVGPWDLAGLVAQVMREEALCASREKDVMLKVPRAEGWPDRETWEQHGIDVTLQVQGWFSIRSRPWQPTWLPGADRVPPVDAVLRRDSRRIDSSVPGDPVWSELLGQETYLSMGQRDAVRASLLLEPGRSMLVVLPTGGGKSMVAHAPALLESEKGATTLLVVPTVALALDQERRAIELFGRKRSGGAPLRSFAYHSGLDPEQKRSMRQRLADGDQPLIIASPEAVVQGLRSALLRCARRGGLRTIVIDEAHMVSQWGNEFRPEFQALAGIRRLLVQASPEGESPRTVLLTATLTQDAWRTLRTLFGTPELGVVAAVHLRPEPTYWIAGAADAASRDDHVLEALRFAPRPLILYTSLREDADRWEAQLRAHGLLRVGKVHGATPAAERARQLHAWSSAGTDVMVATSAFGLGMDQADVRTVLHACVPETLDRYYQEVGRGGRDGRACLALLVHGPRDWDTARSLNKERIVGVKKGLLRWRYMYYGAVQHEGDDRLYISLDGCPPHVQADSDANVAWNLRTLILMARAGLLELDAVEPPVIEREEGESEQAFEERQHTEFERYALLAAVRPTGLNHLDPATWEQRVQPARRETLEADRRSLSQVQRMLEGKERLAHLLVDAYSVDADGVRIVPHRVDGCCPASRAAGLEPGRYLPPEPTVTTAVSAPVGTRLRAVLGSHARFALVAMPSLRAGSLRSWRESLIPILRLLITKGVRELRVPRDWLELAEYRALFRLAQPRIVFHTDLVDSGPSPSLSDEHLVPRLTVVEHSARIQNLLVEVVDSPRPLELLFVPEDLPDPDRRDRALVAVRDHITLARLRMELD